MFAGIDREIYAERAAVRRQRRHFAAGGFVPGSGTRDTIPALLTPGEFVFNREATQRAGVDRLQHFNRGGLVAGAAQVAAKAYGATFGGSQSSGGGVSQAAAAAMNQLSSTLSQFVQNSGGFGQAAQQMAQAITAFGGNATALSDAISQMPKSLAITGQHQVQVTFNGAEVLGKLTPEIQMMVTNEVRTAMGRVFKEQMPDAGVQVN